MSGSSIELGGGSGGGGKKGTEVTVGYKYYAGVHAIPALGPVDAVTEIRVGDRQAWAGDVRGNQQIYINRPELFGGEEREGGVQGYVDIEFGGPAQAQNDYLQGHVVTREVSLQNAGFWELMEAVQEGTDPTSEHVRTNVPAFRGVLGLVFRQFYWTGLNPYFKALAVRVERILGGWGSEGAWYPEKAVIEAGGYRHMNPAHILYQCLTAADWGMGYPRSQIDDASFRAAADTLYAEGFGLSLRWDQQTSLGQFTDLVCDHINASLIVDLTSGLFRLQLVRGDYDAATLPLLTESEVIAVRSFQRRGYGETVNEVTVTYTDTEDGRVRPVTVQDLGNIRAQGTVVTETRELPGLPTPELALRVAQRDLQTLAAPLASLQLECTRAAFGLQLGDVFRLTWPALGIDDVVFRVTRVDLGGLAEGRILLSAVEDIFGLPQSSYAAPQPGGWGEVSREPVPVATDYLFEAPYYLVNRRLEPYQLAELDPDFGFVSVLARRPISTAINYRLHYAPAANDTYTALSGADFTPHAVLAADIGRLDTVVPYTSGRDLDLPEAGYGFIGDEAVEIVAPGAEPGTVEVRRGVLDTVPVAHAAGEDIWLPAGGYRAIDASERVAGETAYYRLTTRSGSAELDLSAAPTRSLTLANRYQRPYPPGNVRVRNSYFPARVNLSLDLTWSHRDRLQQTAGLVAFTAGDVGPEPGTAYTVRVYHPDTGALIHEAVEIAGTAWSDSDGAGGSILDPVTNAVRVTLTSERDGYSGWQAHDFTVERYGYGFRYGEDYGGA